MRRRRPSAARAMASNAVVLGSGTEMLSSLGVVLLSSPKPRLSSINGLLPPVLGVPGAGLLEPGVFVPGVVTTVDGVVDGFELLSVL